ncbi:MAG: Ger(x)C family spore germination protein [Limnochordales bacterium]
MARTRSGGPVQPRNPKTPSTKRAPGRRRRTTALCAVLTALALLPAGCWDHRPPETSAFIIMLGFDEDPEDPAMTAVTQLAIIPGAFAVGNEGSVGLDQTPFYLLSDAAPTLESAQAAVFDHLSRLPSLEHMDAIVFGQDFARAGRATEPAVAWAMRHPQIRPDTFVFVADGPAQPFLDARPVLDPLPGEAISALMKHSDRVHFVFPMRLYEFARTLLSPRIDAAVPLVGRVDPLSARVPPGFSQRAFVGATEGSEPADTQIQLLGMAIFKGKRMVGTLTTDDGSGLRWIYGGNKGILTIPHPVQEGHYIVATSINSSAKRRVRFENGRLVLGIEVQAVMDAWGEGIFEPLAIAKYAPAIERDLAGMIEKNVRKTMERLQELKADIFGFGEELYRSSPKEWDKVAEVWDDVYAGAALEIRARVTLRRTGLSR